MVGILDILSPKFLCSCPFFAVECLVVFLCAVVLIIKAWSDLLFMMFSQFVKEFWL